MFQHVKPEDAGLYTCVASTSTGRISCSAELTVQGQMVQTIYIFTLLFLIYLWNFKKMLSNINFFVIRYVDCLYFFYILIHVYSPVKLPLNLLLLSFLCMWNNLRTQGTFKFLWKLDKNNTLYVMIHLCSCAYLEHNSVNTDWNKSVLDGSCTKEVKYRVFHQVFWFSRWLFYAFIFQLIFNTQNHLLNILRLVNSKLWLFRAHPLICDNET